MDLVPKKTSIGLWSIFVRLPLYHTSLFSCHRRYNLQPTLAALHHRIFVAPTQLDVYIMDVDSDNKFLGLKGIGELAKKWM